MMDKQEQRHVAILTWDIAVTLTIRSLASGPERDALDAARAEPGIETIRTVLDVGQHQPWRRLIEAALIEIALAAVDDILAAKA